MDPERRAKLEQYYLEVQNAARLRDGIIGRTEHMTGPSPPVGHSPEVREAEKRFWDTVERAGLKLMKSLESKEDKLQAIEEKLAHYEELHNRGELSQEDYEHLLSQGREEAERVKEISSVEPDEEHAEAREIWADVQKQFAEGKISKEEFDKYKKLFEHYQFDAPGPISKDFKTFLLCVGISIGVAIGLGIWINVKK